MVIAEMADGVSAYTAIAMDPDDFGLNVYG
jgi:hypothetical protein